MSLADDADLIERFEEFYRNYYRNEIGQLAQKYPSEQRSLYVEWDDLYRYDQDIAEDFVAKPGQMREYAEEALRLYDLPVDVKLGNAHVRVRGLADQTGIREIRADHVGNLVAVQGIVRKATDVRPKMQEAAFECQRCGTLTRIPQSGGGFQEPHECQGCERQGPFAINFDQSEFVDAQKLRIQESPEGLRGGETPQAIDVHIEDDITGRVTAGDHVTATGVLHLDQQENQGQKSAIFDFYMEGLSVEIEDEQFEDMDITEEDERAIIELSNDPDLYEKMVGSLAPSIYGYREEKLAIIMQLFSGVRKELPDKSRIRGDLHMLLIGDPGTGKSQLLQYIRNLAPRSVYTSGKGSSSAGLCVTGDTLIHTEEGFRRIDDIAHEKHPDPVTANTAAEHELGLYSFDPTAGTIDRHESSHVWRMPAKPCRRIETSHGRRIEASTNTPVLTCGESGLEWKPIGDVSPGDYVAAPAYRDIEQTTPPVGEFVEYTNEKVRLAPESIEFLRERLWETYGTLRDAAAALDLTEDFVYDSLSNRFVPIDRLDRILETVDATRDDLCVRRAMLAHGEDVRLPEEFDDELLYLVGLVFGDGDIALDRRDGNRGLVRISNGDEALLERAAEIIERKFDKAVEVEYQEERVPCIRLNSATVARFFSNLGMESPKTTLELDERLTTAEHADAFLRGLMDADGSVSTRDETAGSSSIQFSTISEPLAKQVQLILDTYGVSARLRTRDRRGEYMLESGQTIESKHVQHHLTIYGRHIDTYASEIGFESAEKQAALSQLVGTGERRDDKIPVGSALATAEIGSSGGSYYTNLTRADNPGRQRARDILGTFDLGELHSVIEEAVEADLTWEEVVDAIDTGEKEVYDLTVPETHNFVGNGIVIHNTAAAVRDDFGDGQQWTLEAGALVLADQGIAAIDELDKMSSDDRSAMHQALEQQEISISKAGINATLKSRCSLLGAANPKYGRFDEYEPIAEQIDLEPALVSRFDLIFTITDKPDPEKDRDLAEHIIKTNFAGELHTHRTNVATSNVSQEEVDNVTEEVEPAIEADLLRKYVAFAKRECYPTMTEEAKEAIREFYVTLRGKGEGDDAPVPVTARKLEALVRLAEASARIRLSDTVTTEDTDRVIGIVRSSLEDVGMDPETGEFDADMVEAGTSKSQRDRIKNVKGIIRELQDEYERGAPFDEVVDRAEQAGIDRSKVEHEIQKLKNKGDIYEPQTDHLRVV
jgi:DNA replicative helicase MCM subunit Mcm2 (Cdc46/Mcm family)